jgi:hypothetical protein
MVGTASAADYTALTSAITAEIGTDHATPVYVLTQADYTSGSWTTYSNAIAAAIVVEADAGATPTEVDDATALIASTKAALVFETTAPILDITPVTSPTDLTYQNITGNVFDAGVGMGTVTVNGNMASLSGTVYYYNLTGLLEGSNAITVNATDSVGNIATNSTSITVDTTAPTLEISAPSASLTKGGPITYTVNYTGADAVTLENSNITLDPTGNATGTVAVTGSGTTTMTVNISGITGDGTLGISIAASTASDTAGNLASAAGPSANFTVDNTAPTLDITPVTSPTNVNYQIITGNVSDGTVTVNGTNAPVDSGVYSYNLTDLVEGANEITVIATDSLGNEATASTSITVDTTAPTIPVVTDDGASTTSTTSLHANWTSSDPGSGIAEYFYAIGTSAGATNVVNWTSTETTPNVTASSLSLNVSTTYYFTVKAKDVLGSNSTAGNSDGITVLHSSAPGTYDIGLVPGWNLISLPLIPTNDSIQNVTAGIQNKINTSYGIWYYGSSTPKWFSYTPGGSFDLTKMQAGKGYWIYMDSSTTLTVTGSFLPARALPPEYSVYTGWNLIGIHAQTDKTASDYLANLGIYGTGWSSLFKYTAGQYASISSTGTMDLGNGFWLYAPRNGTLIPN